MQSPACTDGAFTASVKIHPTAILEPGVTIGSGTAVWDNVHIRRNARIGRDCIVGEKTYIAYDVVIGNRVKINASVYICAGVTIEDGCMLSAHVVFTNDRYPRATDPAVTTLQTSNPTEETLETVVRRGATVGANATVGPALELGEFSMIGMGAVVTRSVPPHALAIGNPARVVGWVCRCGKPLRGIGATGRESDKVEGWQCSRCRRRYRRPQRGLALGLAEAMEG